MSLRQIVASALRVGLGVAVVLGGAAAVLGQADDAPGLVLLGLLLMLGGGGMALRSVRWRA